MKNKDVIDLCKTVVKKRNGGQIIFRQGMGVKKNIACDQIDMRQLKMGIGVEMEHTESHILATKIAIDHLAEFPNYYDALEDMEKKLKKKHRR